MSDGYFQRELIPLTDAELQTQSRRLAQCVVDLAEMKLEHAELKKDMAENERQLAKEIRALATVVRNGAKERDVAP